MAIQGEGDIAAGHEVWAALQRFHADCGRESLLKSNRGSGGEVPSVCPA
jgi:hypothetical protein